MFLAIFYTLSSFILYSYFLDKTEASTLYPFVTTSKTVSLGISLFLGPGRNLLLGIFQSFYENFMLQMILLLLLNSVTLFFLRFLEKTLVPKYFMNFKIGFIIIITIFLKISLLNSLKIGFKS